MPLPLLRIKKEINPLLCPTNIPEMNITKID
jgi:hypothetical protein